MFNRLRARAATSLAILVLAGCATDATERLPVPEETRAQDARSFAPVEANLPFAALPGVSVDTDRWHGVLNGSGYRIEVPKNWNGVLVMYAHGYAGMGPELKVSNPAIRRHLIENGYAWAASSYSKNFYDVRAGVEDTNALALAFTQIAAAHNRPLPAPRRTYIMGISMGGHIAAAAIEEETLATSMNKVAYHGAVPMCGVLGDTELFNYFTAYQLAAQYFAGIPATTFPVTDFAANKQKIIDALWITYPVATTAQGDKLKKIVMNLTGGQRPIFDEGFKVKPLQDAVWGGFGTDGTVNGILNRKVADTTQTVYRLTNTPVQSAEERTLNRDILRVKADAGANRRRSDGLRWIPVVQGRFRVPVVTLHTLGDMYVPFRMEQVYRRRAIEQGTDKWLVQRMVRAPGHCDFSVVEQVAAFQAMAEWEQRGVKPSGDEVLDASVVSNPNYGCTYTNNTAGRDDLPALAPTRAGLPACAAK